MNLKKGINLGGFYSQCIHTKEHYDNFIKENDIEYISKLGFDHVRLPIDYELLEDEDGNYLDDGFKRLNETIMWCKKHNLNIVLDLHKTYGYDFNNAHNKELNNLFENEGLQNRFINLWIKIATEFSNKDNVAFELLNEVVEKDNAEVWNILIDKTISEIRKKAPKTMIIYGGIQWNSAATLNLLRKPKDENIMFTFHFYEPLLFTHQNAYWVPSISNIGIINYPETMEYYKERSKKMGEQGENVTSSKIEGNMGKEYMKSIIQKAIDTSKKYGVKLYCGEFGVIELAPLQDTLNWLEDIVSLFNEYEIGYSLWSYKLMDFGIINDHYAPIKEKMIEILTK